ncbi:MAG: hypothetical protein LBU28_10165 [Spirochaetaceae bacterium]|jgi:hypothetical protein|nr:hypothetical protein [Spirochaetaceae bacterium]
MKGIGTEHESSLHRALKFRYAGEGGDTEIARGGYVCDAVRPEGECIEVQTGSFKPLEDKVRHLSRSGPVRIVHPIILVKYIELFDPEGKILSRRKSPRKGTVWDLFSALIYAPELPVLPGLTIELALVEVSERRVRDGRGSWRRRGVSIADRELFSHHGTLSLAGVGAYRRFAPFEGGEPFTARALGMRAGILPALARKTLYVLTRLGITERIGKEGNAWVYSLTPERSAGHA